MKFKIGLLVLVLVLENIVADQRLSKDPTDSLVSALQQEPQLRQNLLRADQSPVRGLLLSGFHHSLNSTGATCAWDEDSEECTLSISSMKHILEKSKTEYAKVLMGRLMCMEKTNIADCNNEKGCVWYGWLSPVCQYLDLRQGHEDSPCAKAAPLYFDYEEARKHCARSHSSESCASKRECYWYPYLLGVCFVDEKFIYYGIKHFEGKRYQVEHMVLATLQSEYSALQSAENFTWQLILDYKPGSIECPSGIEQLVCDYVVAYWSGLQSREFYCSGRYETDASGCQADVLCKWNTDSAECRSHKSYPTLVDRRAAWKVLTDSIPEGTDKSLLEAQDRCEFRSERKCFTEQHCIWNPPGGYCTRNKHYIATLLTKPGKDSADGLCTFLAVDGFSDCYDTFTEADCNQTKVCHWDKHQRCRPKEELYIAKAVELDPELRNKYLQVKGRCSRHTSLIECIEDDHFSSKVKLST